MRRFKIIPLIIVAILVKAGLFLLLWNALIPDIFHGPTLIYQQALGLMVLSKLLVGFGGGGFGRFRHHHRGPFGHHHRHGKGPWCRMSDEEKQKMREDLKSRG